MWQRPPRHGAPSKSSLKRFLYLKDRLVDRNMLPYPKNTPSGRMKSFVDRAIAIDVPLQLGGPVARGIGRHAAMLRTTMPVAAIYEDGQLRSGKHHVGTHPPARHGHCHIYAISEAQRVKSAPQTQFGARVLADIGPHGCRRERWRGRPRQCHIRTSRVFISHLIAGAKLLET